MEHAQMKSAPSLAGWSIAAGAGAVAFGVSLVAMGLGPLQAAFVGAVLCLVVGLILGFPGEAGVLSQPVADDAKAPVLHAAPALHAAPVMSAVPEMPAPRTPAAVMPEAVMPLAPPATGMRRPAALAAARGGAPDDLKRIKGVGPKLEALCQTLGFYHFDQIAAWTADEVAWVDENLEGFRGRVTRDGWVAQARVLAAGGVTEFSKRVDDGEVY